MNITSKNKKLCLEPLRGIVTQGEKLADTVTFRLPDVYGNLTLSALSWQLRAASEKNTLATADLTASASGEFCLVQWEVSADFTAVSGALSLMLVGTDAAGNTVIKFPGDSPIWVRDSETGEYSPPEDAIENALNGLRQAESALEDATKALQEIGINFKILGHFDTLPELEAAVTNPSPGDAYGVGDPTVIYIWNGTSWDPLPGVFQPYPHTNLLVNPRFKYNSRSQQSYDSSSVWSVDGWRVNNGTISVISSGISIAIPGTIWQPIKNENNIFGKQVVFSVKDSSGNMYTVTGIIPSSASGNDTNVATTNTPWGSINIGNSTAHSSASFTVSIYAISNSVTITAAKLELGSVSTLQADLDNPPSEDIEKLKLDMYDLDPGRCAYLPWHNENLLDNWYFVGGGSQQGGGQFPINQRGQTSYTGPNYGIDRWTNPQTGCVAQLNANGVQLNASRNDSFLSQMIENGQRLSGTITFSVLSEASSQYATARIIVFCSDQTVGVLGGNTQLSTISVNLDSCPNIISIEVRAGNLSANESTNLIAAKLELGYLSTLARKDEEGNWVLNDPPPNFQQELAKCQRMYQIYSTASERPTNGYDCRPVMRLAAPSQGTILINDQTWYYNDASL